MTELAKTGLVRSVVLVGYEELGKMLDLPASARVTGVMDLARSQLTEAAGVVVEYETIYPNAPGYPALMRQTRVEEIVEMAAHIALARAEKP